MHSSHPIILPGESIIQERTIRLDTALGNPIDNGQVSEISAFERNGFRIYEKWHSNCTFRAAPTPRYNCHGMTFASRRTGITERKAINDILKDDGYIEVRDRTEVLAGDVIIYFNDDGDAEHSGLVVSSPEAPLWVPKVVSKWGKYAEFIHWANQCPYILSNIRYYRITISDEIPITR